jgi:hypothetical protein
MLLSRHHPALAVVVLMRGLQTQKLQLQCRMKHSFHLERGLAEINPHSALYPPPISETRALRLALPYPLRRRRALEQWSHRRIEVRIPPI